MSVWLWLEVHLKTAIFSSTVLGSSFILTVIMLLLGHFLAHSSKVKHEEAKRKLRKQLIENIAEQIKLENEALANVGNDQEKSQEKEIAKLEKEICVLEEENMKISDILNSIRDQSGQVEQELKEKEPCLHFTIEKQEGIDLPFDESGSIK